MFRLTPDILLAAYAAGVFPMAESAEDPELFWVDPHHRGILPLDGFHVPNRLRRVVRQGSFEIRCDSAFEDVIRGCAEATEKRPNTWINDEIVRLYAALFARGAAHSVESWQDGILVGGLYGVSIGAAFFGETRGRYHRLLADALAYRASFPAALPDASRGDPLAALQSSKLTS